MSIVIIAGLLSLWLLPLSSSVAKQKPICGDATAVTIQGNQKIRVFKVSRPASTGSSRRVSLVLACAASSKSRLLGATDTTSYKGKFLPAVDTKNLLLRPPWVGYVQTNSGVDTWTMIVTARNLRTGALTYCSVGGSRPPNEAGPTVTGIALKSNGSLAWIGTGNKNPSSILGPFVSRVAECGATGTTILDEGEGIDLQSLELHNSVLQWMDSGNLRTAALP